MGKTWINNCIFFTLACFTVAVALRSASGTEPRWGLQRIVQREKLTLEQISSGVKKYDLGKVTKARSRINIYIIDSGVHIDHQDFSGSRAEYGINIESPGSLPSDCDGHGTHVAAIAVGVKSGVASQARAIAVRILDCQGRGSCSDVLSAFEFVLSDSERRRKDGQRSVAVLSVGSVNSACSSSLDVSQELWDKGVVLVAAAGNDNADACDMYPARNPSTIAVGATDKDDRVYKKNNFGDCIDCFAPGVDILSAWGNKSGPDWKLRTGSSMAAPVVAGMSALILGALPNLTSAEVRQILVSSTSRNRILASSGTQVMSNAVNRLVYAPWGRLFEEIEMNSQITRFQAAKQLQRQQFDESIPGWNSSASIIALSMTLKPKTVPAMAYAASRITAALSSAAGIRTSSFLVRRVAGVKMLPNGKEPESIPLVFYMPTSPSLSNEYKRRLVLADKTRNLEEESGETFSFAQGSIETAILMNVTVPKKASSNETLGGDRLNDEESDEIGTGAVIALISVGLILVAGLLVVVAVLVILPRIARARERRQTLNEIRRLNTALSGRQNAATAEASYTNV